jgi:hypothetical protein
MEHLDQALVRRLIERSQALARMLDLGPIYYDNIWQVVLRTLSGEKSVAIQDAVDELITISNRDVTALRQAEEQTRDSSQGLREDWADKLLGLAAQKLENQSEGN